MKYMGGGAGQRGPGRGESYDELLAEVRRLREQNHALSSAAAALLDKERPAPAAKIPAPGAQWDLAAAREECARLRRRCRLLKFVSAALLLALTGIVGAVFFIYSRFLRAVPALAGALQALQAYSQPAGPSAPAAAGGPAAVAPAYLPAAGPDARLARAVAKYSDRPIAREIMADLQRHPELLRVIREHRGGGQAELLAALRRAPGAEQLAVKYASRPEFMALLNEVMNDPELRQAAAAESPHKR